jgi:fumarate hydratase subunit beta
MRRGFYCQNIKRGGFALINIETPVTEGQISSLKITDRIEISGKIFAGRDAVLPRVVKLIREDGLQQRRIFLEGAVIFHTAVSPAGIGPTSSNKPEIESSIPLLSSAGVRIHLGKGALGADTVIELEKNNSIFCVTPPLTALFADSIVSKKIIAFPEEGMEALWELEVKGIPAFVAIAHGETIFK